jgi:hypothetical protein
MPKFLLPVARAINNFIVVIYARKVRFNSKLRLHCYRHNFTVPASIIYCLWVRPGAYSRVEYLKGWKGLPGINALAYYENS